jgi:uncharacterized protein (TIGR02270 family)
VIRRAAVRPVLDQHVEDLAILWNTRRELAVSGHVALRHLARFDRRIAAHLDGCVIGGNRAIETLRSELATATASRLFAIGATVLETLDRDAFDICVAVCEAERQLGAGLRSALGWVEPQRLSGLGQELVRSRSPFQRQLGLSAFRLHGVSPQSQLVHALMDVDAGVREEGHRLAGTIGSVDAVSGIRFADGHDEDNRFWAAWAAVLLGERTPALAVLRTTASSGGPHKARAFRLALQAMNTDDGHATLQQIAADPADVKWLVLGTGICGNPTYVPWLIGHMATDQNARLAGEAFSLITGADLALLDLERKPPENFESGPNDDPNDPSVDMDPDDGLPWPDPDKIETWWAANEHRFQKGQRYFMGKPVTREHCIDVLKNGYQRQRILAAHYLCLLDPGTPLFNTSAPAWRQQKQLAQLT